MVTPLSPAAAMANGQTVLPVERPAPAPEPAVQVTASNPASLGGNAAQSGGSQNAETGAGDADRDALERVNESLQAWSTGIRFEMDDEADRLVVSIVDRNSGDVIRQIPSEAVLKVAKMIIQLQGSGVDTRA